MFPALLANAAYQIESGVARLQPIAAAMVTYVVHAKPESAKTDVLGLERDKISNLL
jgi:hypothetical protein